MQSLALFSSNCVPPLACFLHQCFAPPLWSLLPVTSAKASRARFLFLCHDEALMEQPFIYACSSPSWGFNMEPLSVSPVQSSMVNLPVKAASLIQPVSLPHAEYSAPSVALEYRGSLSTLGCHDYFHPILCVCGACVCYDCVWPRGSLYVSSSSSLRFFVYWEWGRRCFCLSELGL